MALAVGKQVVAEYELMACVVEEVLRGDPSARYRIRWDDGHESIYTPASGARRADRNGPRQAVRGKRKPISDAPIPPRPARDQTPRAPPTPRSLTAHVEADRNGWPPRDAGAAGR